ncbi:putative sodium-coupled neutral amino acid transporter 7 [Apostichopus japonicus]|uniref:Putative sodium-coupled neutral amino acid transporter 7 n=1 Tax=Stichopus japonicus TaxID=307972 RepID=A0A2G8JHS4_STIJA|nr:putative sodium-coupled neutral amino acid transporter 7 [Apostichopus japonicus]
MGSLNADAYAEKESFLTTSTDCNSSDENVSLLGNVSIRPYPQAQEGRTSFPGAVFIIVNACIGAGILNFPAAYAATGGPVAGVIVQLVLLLFIICSLLILALCADIKRSSTYQDVISSMCGKHGRICCEICIILYCFGACITFLIVIGDQTDLILQTFLPEDVAKQFWAKRQFMIFLLGTFILYPLCLPKKVDFLKYPSSVGVFATLYVCAVIILTYYLKKGTHTLHPTTHSDYSWTRGFAAVPTICFGFQCHLSSVPVYASLKHRNVKHFSLIVLTAMSVSSVAYILSGTFGYLTFGFAVCPDILSTYSAKNAAISVARVMILVNMLTTYPVLHYCGRLALETMYKGFRGMAADDDDPHERRRRAIETTSWFVLSLLLAMFLPNIQVVISPIGGLAAVFIFVFPGLCFLQFIFKHSATSERKRQYLIAAAIAFVAIGTFIFGTSVTQSVMDDISGQSLAQCVNEASP